MDHDTFAQSAAAITEAIDLLAVRKGISPADTAAIAGASLGQVMTRHLGPFGAVTRLRDLADVFEKRLLDGLN